MSDIIIIEGIDGAGKTTLARVIEKYGYQYHKYPNLTTASGREIQRALADGVDHSVLQHLMHLNRIEDLPLFASGDHVIDRYWPSAVAYADTDELSDFAAKNYILLPDAKYIFLRCSIDTAIERIRKRAEKPSDLSERFEKRNVLEKAVVRYAGIERRVNNKMVVDTTNFIIDTKQFRCQD